MRNLSSSHFISLQTKKETSSLFLQDDSLYLYARTQYTGTDDDIVAANLFKTLQHSNFLTVDKDLKISYHQEQKINELTPDLFL